MITKSPERKESNWFKQELENCLIKTNVKSTDEVINFCEEKLGQITNNYPNLKDEFSRAILEAFELASSGILIDNSMIVSPLGRFANKHDHEDILEVFDTPTEDSTWNSWFSEPTYLNQLLDLNRGCSLPKR
jgi:hypothetical protein